MLLAAKVPLVELNAGQKAEYWAKFPVPAEVANVTLFFPDAPPMEKLTISAAESAQPAASKSGESGGGALASEPNNRGARVEVTQVRRSGDGFVEIRWRFVNPGGDEKLRVLS